jgi:hypothetical protein
MNDKNPEQPGLKPHDGIGKPVFVQICRRQECKILGFDVVVMITLQMKHPVYVTSSTWGYKLPEGIMVEYSTQSSFRAAN